MSSLRFIKAPHRPEHVSAEVWDSEWIGLQVGLAAIFPQTIGCLGDLDGTICRVFDNTTGLFRYPKQVDAMNQVTIMLSDSMWISREALIHCCECAHPPKTTILAWLGEDSQLDREVFAVPVEVAEYLP